ncbi:putative ADP/ATP carrier protein, bacteria [Helianthus annuus]|nr:putative ADP/ATP carrier protein, bacteria [Helianthus annuus]
MEGVIQTKGVFLSLPSNPQSRIFLNKIPQQFIRQRFNLSLKKSKPTNLFCLKPKSPNGFSPNLNGSRKFHGFGLFDVKKLNTLHVCKASAGAGGGGGGAGELEVDPPKFMGVEVLTLKKIIPLGLMFFCILFNYTILRDTKDVLVVTRGANESSGS